MPFFDTLVSSLIEVIVYAVSVGYSLVICKRIDLKSARHSRLLLFSALMRLAKAAAFVFFDSLGTGVAFAHDELC